MQFHLNGFRPGDPEIFPAAPGREAQGDSLPETVDVLIVGAGPAGLTLAAQLAQFPEITTRLVEQKDGPMERGQADGISCRSMEMFNAFGFGHKILNEGCNVTETTFWKPSAENAAHIERTGRVDDVQEGLSEMPHMILNQARVHDMYLDIMKNSPSRMVPDYSRELVSLTVDENAEDYPVSVTIKRVDAAHDGQIETLRARYVVGCDGARSAVRKSIGRELVGDAANQAWGVMDVLPVTTFPDIRYKALIQSAGEGNIVLIPREGGYLVRIYVELDKLKSDERVRSKNITLEQLIAAAQRIFQPYELDVKDVAWWSVYEIGQRITDKFDDVPADLVGEQMPHVFIAGDACHTHSPKAGQGMNVSMGDTFNLGWKLAAVLRGLSAPDLLHSYSAERQSVAQDLIDFDREWSKIISAPPSDDDIDESGVPKFQRYFIEHGRYTAGMQVTYQPSKLTGEATYQDLATGFPIGERLHSWEVTRVNDAKPVHLGHTVAADGRWRLTAFAGEGDPMSAESAIAKLGAFLADDPTSPLNRYTPKGADPDAVIDARVVFQQSNRDLDVNKLPTVFLPRKGKFALKDYEKMFSAAVKHGPDIYEARGIDRSKGALVIQRPDQYVAHILPLDDHAGLSAFFEGIFLVQN